jgi:hypothetical protein
VSRSGQDGFIERILIVNPTNPYSPPTSDISTAPDALSSFGELSDKELKKLYCRSCNVSAIAALLLLGLITMLGVTMMAEVRDMLGYVMMGLSGLYVVAFIGIVLRTSWGRILGVIVSALSLLSLPIGTIVGAFGLFAFLGAPQLFGKNRIRHKNLKAEFKFRKKAAKEAKRAAKAMR